MYHVNPETGKFDICHAESPENCPFGIENHSDNLEDIQIKADKINKNKFKIPTEKELNNIIKQDKISGYDFSNQCDFIKMRKLSCNNIKFDKCYFSEGLIDSKFDECEFIKIIKTE